MTPATRDRLRVYAERMGYSYTQVVREFRRNLSKTEQGKFLTEAKRVEEEFLKELERRARRQYGRRFGMWLGRRLGALARLLTSPVRRGKVLK